MSDRVLMVVGAGGDVGQGVVAAALRSGRRVVACGRSAAPLDRLAARHGGDPLACVAGTIASEAEAAELWARAQAPFGAVGEVVISVNAGGPMQPLLAWDAAGLSDMLAGNLLTHFNAAKAFLPRLPKDGMFLGIGGGTADFIIANMAHFSIAQAGLRMLYRGLARECREGPLVRELMIVSMVNGASSRARARPEWLTDEEIGSHVCAILDSPQSFPDTVLRLESREQLGQSQSA